MEPRTDKEEEKEILACLRSGWITEAKRTEEFEKRVAEFVGASHAIAVNNGTISLTLSLLALGIKPNDEVIVPDMTMVATANAVLLAGAVPVLTDVRREDLTIDAKLVEKKITYKTKAIIPVAMNARAPEMKELLDLAKKHKLKIVEDAAQALGSYHKNKHLGTFGDCGSFSFSTPKIITTGQGGMVVTNSIQLKNKLYRLKDFGRKNRTSKDHNQIGWNFKFTDLQAAIGLAQLKKLPARIDRKKEIYQIYENNLTGLTGLEMLETDLNQTTPWFADIYVKKPQDLKNYLNSVGIGTLELYPPLHTLKVHQSHETFTNATWASKHGLWLPSSSFLTNSDINRICREIKYFLRNGGNKK